MGLEKHIAVIDGDGIGIEVTREAIKALNAVAGRFGHTFKFEHLLMGGCAIDAFGVPLPRETLDACKRSDAVLLGAVGGPKWENMPVRPEDGLLGIRKALGLYANLRPAVMYEQLKAASPLKNEIIEGGVDILIVRELTGGIYFGKKGRTDSFAYDTESYSVVEIERIVKTAIDAARHRKRHVTVVDKANVLESSRLWRTVAGRLAAENEDVELDYMYVDNAAMQLIRSPRAFDVLVTSNMFGDILSDEASQITGSLGMLPSASLGTGSAGLYEPVHGSAPDIAGKNIANPIAAILSSAMMLRYSFGMEEEARQIENAVSEALDAGIRTADIAGGGESLSTSGCGDAIARRIAA